ncbi:MFS transporter [Aurantiacibacter suaedae]|uniref:MFS transporter n=1 Tax=Aurantiacibacter suaedae TaxID=2545755 RepID=UPI0010F7140F|nr:MFS transporter [Aurantiacibacter suaedae]
MSAAANPATSKKSLAVVASAIAIEGYDLSIYALFALSIAYTFFDQAGSATGLLLAVATLGVGYVMRPLGGVLLGLYADRVGRKAAIALIVLMMSASTGLIGLIPSYPAIGLAAPILVVLLRLVQGFFSGGAAAGSISFLVESAPPNKRAFYASWQQASQVGAFLLSALIGAAISSALTPEELNSWGWRVPFVLALLFGPLGLYIKRSMPDPESFKEARAEAAEPAAKMLTGTRPSEVLIGAGLSCLWNVTAFILLYFMPTYAQSSFGIDMAAAFRASCAGAATLFVLCPLMGMLSDRYGCKPVMLAAAIGLAVLIYPALAFVAEVPTEARLIIAQMGLAVLIAAYTAPISALLAELFPIHRRSTGLSIAYNLSTLIVGGFGPFFVTWLMIETGDQMAPAYYVAGAALISTVALLFAREADR